MLLKGDNGVFDGDLRIGLKTDSGLSVQPVHYVDGRVIPIGGLDQAVRYFPYPSSGMFVALPPEMVTVNLHRDFPEIVTTMMGLLNSSGRFKALTRYDMLEHNVTKWVNSCQRALSVAIEFGRSTDTQVWSETSIDYLYSIELVLSENRHQLQEVEKLCAEISNYELESVDGRVAIFTRNKNYTDLLARVMLLQDVLFDALKESGWIMEGAYLRKERLAEGQKYRRIVEMLDEQYIDMDMLGGMLMPDEKPKLKQEPEDDHTLPGLRGLESWQLVIMAFALAFALSYFTHGQSIVSWIGVMIMMMGGYFGWYGSFEMLDKAMKRMFRSDDIKIGNHTLVATKQKHPEPYGWDNKKKTETDDATLADNHLKIKNLNLSGVSRLEMPTDRDGYLYVDGKTYLLNPETDEFELVVDDMGDNHVDESVYYKK